MHFLLQHWYNVCLDESLWKSLFVHHLKLPHSTLLPAWKETWRSEYERIIDRAPVDLKEELEGHTDEIYHISFSVSGQFISTTGRDGSVRVSTCICISCHEKHLYSV